MRHAGQPFVMPVAGRIAVNRKAKIPRAAKNQFHAGNFQLMQRKQRA